MLVSVFPFCPTSEISSLTPCSISHHFKTLHYCLSNSFFWTTFLSIFHVFFSTLVQRTPFVWFSPTFSHELKLMLGLVLCQLLSLLFGSHKIVLFLSFTISKLTFSDSLILPKFLFHLNIVDQLCSIPGLRVCSTTVLDVPLSSILFEDIGTIEVS